MGAGAKSDLIVVQSVTITEDEYGAPVETWADSFSVFAEYQPAGTREFPVSHKRVAETTARFIIWYREDIHAATHRIVARGKVWNIAEPLGDHRRIETMIEASEVQ